MAAGNNGDDGDSVSSGAGNVLIETFNAVIGNPAVGGGDGIAVTNTTGSVTIVTQNTGGGRPGHHRQLWRPNRPGHVLPVTGTLNGITTIETGTNT